MTTDLNCVTLTVAALFFSGQIGGVAVSGNKAHRVKPTPTPTAVPTATLTPIPSTPTPGPAPTVTPTPVPTATGTPQPSPSGTPTAVAVVLKSTLVITSADNGKTFSHYKISTTSGDCVDMNGASNVTFEQSDIGPCAGHAIFMNGGSGNNVYDNYLHSEGAGYGCCDNHEGIRIAGASTIDVQGNVIAYNESNIRVDSGSNGVTINGNYGLNPLGPYPRGQNYQSDTVNNVKVESNYFYSCTLPGSTLGGVTCSATAPDGSLYLFSENQEDSVNFYVTTTFTAQNNYVVGGHSPSGCGIIFDYEANGGQVIDNILSSTGQCGVGVANGTNPVVSGNKILQLTPISGAGNTAIYTWNQYSPACGPTLLNNNTATMVLSPGNYNSYWDGGGCGPVTESGNIFDQAAYDALYPMSTTNPPPLIPPLPKNCVAASPYSTQTSMPGC